jgi:hypothetical protein
VNKFLSSDNWFVKRFVLLEDLGLIQHFFCLKEVITSEKNSVARSDIWGWTWVCIYMYRSQSRDRRRSTGTKTDELVESAGK